MAEIIKIGRNHDSKKLLTNPQDPTVSKLHLQLFIDDDYKKHLICELFNQWMNHSPDSRFGMKKVWSRLSEQENYMSFLSMHRCHCFDCFVG